MGTLTELGRTLIQILGVMGLWHAFAVPCHCFAVAESDWLWRSRNHDLMPILSN